MTRDRPAMMGLAGDDDGIAYAMLYLTQFFLPSDSDGVAYCSYAK